MTHQFIGHFERLVCEIICHKFSTAIVLIQLLMLEVGWPHSCADELLQILV